MVDGLPGPALEDARWAVEEGNRHGIGHVTAHILSMVAMTVRGVMSIIETVTQTHVQVRITKKPEVQVGTRDQL